VTADEAIVKPATKEIELRGDVRMKRNDTANSWHFSRYRR
jgi:hypothetical protein